MVREAVTRQRKERIGNGGASTEIRVHESRVVYSVGEKAYRTSFSFERI